jgi:hypothetical protein
MYTLIRLRDGRTIEAVVLANTRSWMRLVTPGHNDAVELQLRGLEWVDERDEPVQFEFLTAEDGCSAVPWQPRVAHAGAGRGNDLAYG